MKNCRIYPLRTTSSIWKIKLYSSHMCTERCKISYISAVIDSNTTALFLYDNPEYKDGLCQFNDTRNQSVISLSQFRMDQPSTVDGDLLLSDEIVIPDKKIILNVTFPLQQPKKISISSNRDDGFTLSYLIDSIRRVYEWIYEVEEKTATEREFYLVQECKCEDRLQLYHNKTENDENNENKMCPICLEKISSEYLHTDCDHSYHNDCLMKWIEEDKTTCPLCRKNIIQCNECYGTKWKSFLYTGKIIPIEYRKQFGISRNPTDGIFQISQYDMDELILQDMIYHRDTKMLYINMYGVK